MSKSLRWRSVCDVRNSWLYLALLVGCLQMDRASLLARLDSATPNSLLKDLFPDWPLARELSMCTVSDARDGYETDIALVTGLTVGVVAARLRIENGNTKLKKAFEDAWPADPIGQSESASHTLLAASAPSTKNSRTSPILVERGALRTALDAAFTFEELGAFLDEVNLPKPRSSSERLTSVLNAVYNTRVIGLERAIIHGANKHSLTQMANVLLNDSSGTSEELRDRLCRVLLGHPTTIMSPRSELYRERFLANLAYDAASASGGLREYQVAAVESVLAALQQRPRQPHLLHLATGGGKTRVANDVVKRWFELHAWGHVLWITKDWWLLHQALTDLRRRSTVPLNAYRLGGDGNELHPLPEFANAGHASIIYTTLGSFQGHCGKLQTGAAWNWLTVWDECHWGEDGDTGRAVRRWCADERVPLLGLTATPRSPDRSDFLVAYSKTFKQLLDLNFLAKPTVQEVDTGADWEPQRLRAGFDFTPASLDDLARDGVRNQLIVETYLGRREGYGKTILFACNVEHANELTDMLCRSSVHAAAIHSQLSRLQIHEARSAFQAGALDVLVNVAMLTHGVDFPDVRTLFMARPTLSDILYSQMVGRGARRHDPSGKTEFNLVEFSDNLRRFSDQLVTSKLFFEGAAGVR